MNATFLKGLLVALLSLTTLSASAATESYTVFRPSTQLANGMTTKAKQFRVARPLPGTYVPGVVIVKTRGTYRVGKGEQTLGSATLAPTMAYAKVSAVEHAMVPLSRANDPFVMAVGLDRVYTIRYEEPIEPFDLCMRLMQDPDVEYAVPEYIATTGYTPNDSRYANQTYLAPIKVAQAWDVTKGSKDILVAIVDSGTDHQHEDLSPNIFTNTKEVAGNGKDDDGNGYIDDVRGWDFVGSISLNEYVQGTIKPDNDPRVQWGSINDRQAHGTTTAGCAAAVANNGKGIAGTGFNVTILPCKVGSDNPGFGGIIQGYAAIRYAADMGADIINCSWGGYGADPSGQDIIDYAISKGAVVVAATGNDGIDLDVYPHFPSCFDGVLSVGSTNNSDRVSGFSNYGWKTTTFAPGENILSTFPGNQYRGASGTSFSCPLVAGVAALVKSVHPDWTPFQIMMQIRVTSDAMATVPVADRPKYWGRVNAERAVKTNASWTTGDRLPGLYVSEFKVGTGSVITRRDPATVTLTISNVLADATTSAVDVVSLDPRCRITSGSTTNTGAIARNGTRDVPVTVQLDANYPWYESSVPLTITMRAGSSMNMQLVDVPVRLSSNNALSVSGAVDGVRWTAAKLSASNELWATGVSRSNGQNVWLRVLSGQTSANVLPMTPMAFDAVSGKALIGGVNAGAATIARYSGGSWPTTSVSTIASSVAGIFMSSATEGIFIGDALTTRFGVGQTTDGGTTWKEYGTRPQILQNERIRSGVSCAIDGNIWFVTSSNRVIRSADGGKTWAPANFGITSSTPLSISFRDDKNGLILYQTGSVYRLAASTDGGTTWRAQTTDLKLLGSDPIAVSSSGDHHVIVCQDGAVFGTDDNGSTYQTILSKPQTGVIAARAQSFTSSVVVFAGDIINTLTYRYSGPNGSRLLEATQAALDFDTLSPNQGRNRFVTIKGVGTGIVNVDSYMVIPDAAVLDTAFKITNTPNATIEAGSSSQVTIRFSAPTPGVYTGKFRVTSNATPPVMEIPMTAVVTAPVSVVDEGAMAAIHASPNPVIDVLTVRAPGDRPLVVDLIDQAGRIVARQPVEAGRTEFELVVTDLSAGAYRLLVRGEGVAKTVPIVIVR